MIDPDVLQWRWSLIKENLDKLGYDTSYINTAFSKDNLHSLDEAGLIFVSDHILKNLETLSYGGISPMISVTELAKHIPEEYMKMGVTPGMVLHRFSRIIHTLNTDRFGAEPWINELSRENLQKALNPENLMVKIKETH